MHARSHIGLLRIIPSSYIHVMAVETNYSYNAFIIGRSIIIAHVISANFEQMEHNKFDMNVTQFHSIVQHTYIIIYIYVYIYPFDVFHPHCACARYGQT